MIIVVDDEDRENEGDFIMLAEKITPEAVNFMAMHGRGLICVPMVEKRLQDLRIDPMVLQNSALLGTAFTVSVDLIKNVTTGISAQDRARTIRALVDPNSRADDFARPGHIFPLAAAKGGVLRRAGHTEAVVDLARLAGAAGDATAVGVAEQAGCERLVLKLDVVADEEGFQRLEVAVGAGAGGRRRDCRCVRARNRVHLGDVEDVRDSVADAR